MTTTETPDAGLAEKAAELLKGLDKTHVGAAMSKVISASIGGRPSKDDVVDKSSDPIANSKRHEMDLPSWPLSAFTVVTGGNSNQWAYRLPNKDGLATNTLLCEPTS